MNKIKAKVLSIQNCDLLNFVDFDFDGFKISMISLELEDLDVGDEVILSFKPSSICLTKDLNISLSCSNLLQGQILQIEHGELLSCVKIQLASTKITSIISKKSALKMSLEEKDEIVCLIRANDLSILEKV